MIFEPDKENNTIRVVDGGTGTLLGVAAYPFKTITWTTDVPHADKERKERGLNVLSAPRVAAYTFEGHTGPLWEVCEAVAREVKKGSLAEPWLRVDGHGNTQLEPEFDVNGALGYLSATLDRIVDVGELFFEGIVPLETVLTVRDCGHWEFEPKEYAGWYCFAC